MEKILKDWGKQLQKDMRKYLKKHKHPPLLFGDWKFVELGRNPRTPQDKNE